MFLLIDKPKGTTSHDVVDKVREITGEKRVGHAGTLDPNATGLLIVGIGRNSTKKLGRLSKNTRKTYKAVIFLGEERDTDDSEGIVLSKARGLLVPSEREVKNVVESFVGKQKQTPPIYSAIKIKGKKAYKFARKGEKLSLKPRDIIIYSLDLLNYSFPKLEVNTVVSSGTYIRSLARDIGKRLGCGAYLSDLQRTNVGKYSLDKSCKVEFINKKNWKKVAISID